MKLKSHLDIWHMGCTARFPIIAIQPFSCENDYLMPFWRLQKSGWFLFVDTNVLGATFDI